MTTQARLITQRLGFFVAGVLFSWAAFYVGFERVFHEGFNYYSQPTWYRIVGTIVGYLPLINIGVLVLLRVTYTRGVKPVAYSLGVSAFYVGLFALLLIADSHSPF